MSEKDVSEKDVGEHVGVLNEEQTRLTLPHPWAKGSPPRALRSSSEIVQEMVLYVQCSHTKGFEAR